MKKLIIVLVVGVGITAVCFLYPPLREKIEALLPGEADVAADADSEAGAEEAGEGEKPTDPDASVATDASMAGAGGEQGMAYVEPNLDHALFDRAALTLPDEKSHELQNMLVDLAARPETPSMVKTKALALVFNLDPLNRQAFELNMIMARGELPPPPQESDAALPDAPTLAENLWTTAKSLRSDKDSAAENRILSACLLSLLTELEPENVDYAFEMRVSRTEGIEIDWGLNQTTAPAPNDPWEKDTGADGKNAPVLSDVQSQIKGLLVRPLDASQYAGKASQMNATAMRQPKSREINVIFNQEVGPMMQSALDEVMKYLRVRHEEFPMGYSVEIAFEEQYIPKDGPSAAVACALLLESLVTGFEIDPNFAVTGDLNADGTVQPVGGITGKLRGAERQDCDVVAIPVANERVISDMVIGGGPESLLSIQIFSLETFEDALALAHLHSERGEDVRKGIELFKEVQEVLQRPNGIALLTNAHVQERLQECIKLTPNHLSARYLLLAGLGRMPTELSLQGSLEYIDRTAEPLLRVLRQGDFNARSAFEDDEFADAASALSRINLQLDPRTRNISNSIIDYSRLLRTFVNERPKSNTGLRALVDKIQDSAKTIMRDYDDLESRVDYQEEMMK